MSSDRELGIAIVLERASRRLAAAKEFRRVDDGSWRVEQLRWYPGLLVVAGRWTGRAGVASAARIADHEFPVEVSPEGWWALVAMVDGVEHPHLEQGLQDPS